MELFRDFGFEPTLFFAQIINFLILAYVFKRFLYKPILKVLKDREHKIKQGLKDADQAAADRQNAEAERERIIKQAGVEAEKILTETKKTAEEMKNQILEQTR